MLRVLAEGPPHRRDDSGTVAVVVALASVMLFGIAALVVDLGNGFVRQQDVQRQADFASLAGGAEDPPWVKAVSHPVVLAARDRLNGNHVYNAAAGACRSSGSCVTAEALVNGDDADGEVYVEAGDTLRVVAPRARVDFGMAGVFGLSSVQVQEDATVRLMSPGSGAMPSYAVAGCDWGPQTLTAPATGHVATTVPPLDDSPGTGDATVSSLTPAATPVGASGQVLTISGDRMGTSSKTVVGFYRDNRGSAPTRAYVPTDPSATPTPSGVEVTGTGANMAVTVTVPSEVTAVEDVWWVRVGVRNAADVVEWSPASEARPLRVGEAILECAAGSSDGNFGALVLPRRGTAKADWLPTNMALGMQAPLSVHTFDGIVATSGECNPSPPTTSSSFGGASATTSTRYSATAGNPAPTDLLTNTNCVDTDTGLPAGAATQGMITGTSTAPTGRLRRPTSSACSPGRSDRTVTVASTAYQINDDVLTCFFLDDAARIADVDGPTYSYNGGQPVISSEIYSSPRFFWVPVLKVLPTSGGSQHYAITDFRAAFLCDQPGSASRAAPLVGTDNGVQLTGNYVTSLKVVFFNWRAISVPNGGSATPYMGAGPKLVRLVD